MAKTSDEIVVAGTGSIQIAPFGTALPDGSTAVLEALDAAFIELGFSTEAGVEFKDGTQVNELKAWQSLYPVRRMVASYTGSAKFTLLQWNKDVFEQIFHGVVTETVADTVHKFVPTRAGVIAEKSLVIDTVDGANNYRIVIPKCGLAGDIIVPLNAQSAGNVPAEFGIIGDGTLDPWFMLTDDEAFSID